MNIKRKYTQFNDLVFDDYDRTTDYSATFRVETSPRVYSSGDIPLLRSGTQHVDAQSLSLVVKINIKSLVCDERVLVKQYILTNLNKPGRLWAVEGDEILWAWAVVEDMEEITDSDLNYIQLTLNFLIWEGVWHKADPMKTFFYPYRLCDFNACNDYQTVRSRCNPGGAEGCIECNGACDSPATGCNRCHCNCEEPYLTLCGDRQEAVRGLHSACSPEYRISYDCKLANRIWRAEELLGQKFCKSDWCDSMLTVRFYSDTIQDTTGVSFTIKGYVKNPYLALNGNSLQINGEYDGLLTVTGGGEVYYQLDSCCEPEPLDPNMISIPLGSTLGQTVHNGWNTLHIETNECCDMVCVFVKTDSITI